MKITIIILALIITGITNIISQNLYCGIGGGYGFAAAKGDYQNTLTTTNASNSTSIEYTNKTYSYGKGINFSAYFGNMFTKHIGVELNADYLIGNTHEMKTEYNPYQDPDTKKSHGRMLRLIPAIKFTEGEKRFHPYIKAGLIIGVLPAIIEDHDYTISSGPGPPSFSSHNQETRKYTGGTSFGFHGAAGIDIALDDRVALFAELAGYFQSYSPKKSKLTAYYTPGQSGLGGMSIAEIETDYYSTYTPPNPAVPQDFSKPSKGLKFYTPFSSIGFNIGVHFSIVKKAKEKKD